MASRVSAHRPPAPHSTITALVVVDQRPIQRAVWSEFHAARKLHEKTARDLHRHEETDTPAFERWLHASFPTQLTALRELHQHVESLSRDVENAQYLAAVSGRPVKKIWREHKEHLARPQPAANDDPAAGSSPENDPPPPEDFYDEPPGFSPFARPFSEPPAEAARDIYRRLVQHLHPDRGGDWTPVRERLWHEVQQAWDARDTDWLARLEIEWETAHDLINESSSIDRLRRAVQELRAARRDTERKLRSYRKAAAWRFTLSENKRAKLHRRIESEMDHDIDVLERQLDYLKATVAAWEASPPSRGSRPRRRA